MVGCISDPGDKIATNRGSKSTTENRIAIRVICATGPYLINVIHSSKLQVVPQATLFGTGH